MNWLSNWLRPSPAETTSRWVVLDVETSGLDAQRDALLAIAAIALRIDWPHARLHIDLGDSFEVVLQQSQSSSKDNILLHGIGAQRQKDGVPAQQALRAFERYCNHAPLLAFHAAFDRTMLGRYNKAVGLQPTQQWVDIEHLCAATHSGVPARSLDEWMVHFDIHCAQRHQAAADTLAECELLQRIWPAVARQCHNWRDVQTLANQHRWIPRV